MAAIAIASQRFTGTMKRYEAIAIAAIVRTQISSLFNGEHFHYHCTLCCLALHGESYRDANSVSIFVYYRSDSSCADQSECS